MRKIIIIFYFALVLSGATACLGQNIYEITGLTISYGNQVFDASGSMYYISSNSEVSKLDAATGISSPFPVLVEVRNKRA